MTEGGGGDGGGRAAEEENDEAETSAVLDQAIQSKGIVCLTNMAWWTTDAEVQAACSEFGHVVSGGDLGACFECGHVEEAGVGGGRTL